MNLISDTNVWYDIATGARDPRIRKSGGNRLIATPITFLEIASKIKDSTSSSGKRQRQRYFPV
jgi:predicted nucleic acid-binding protein